MINFDKYKEIPFSKRQNCVICGNELVDPVIKLPQFPLTEVYVQEAPPTPLGLVDQEFYYCEHCGHGQISNIIEPEFLYGDTYQTRTSTSSSAISSVEIFLDFINGINKNGPIDTLLEVGCNDLYTLNQFRGKASKLVGIDPMLGKFNNLDDDDIILIDDFIENVDFDFLNSAVEVVICSQTLEHISDPKKTVKKMLDISNENTLLFFQFPGLEGLIRDARFDQVFHQHLNYFSLKSVIYMLEDLGAELVDFKINTYHWSSLMIAFRKKIKNSARGLEKFKKSIVTFTRKDILMQYNIFKNCMDATNDRIRSLKSETIYGFGAALMLPVLDYHLKDGLSNLVNIIDADLNKVGKFYLNIPIKIVHPNSITNLENSIMVLTAISSMDAGRKIIPQLIDYNVKQIILPINTI